MEYHSRDRHKGQCHSVSEQVVLLSFICKHLPVKRQKTYQMSTRVLLAVYLVLRGLSLHSCVTGLTLLPWLFCGRCGSHTPPLSGEGLCGLTSSMARQCTQCFCRCFAPSPVAPPSHQRDCLQQTRTQPKDVKTS